MTPLLSDPETGVIFVWQVGFYRELGYICELNIRFYGMNSSQTTDILFTIYQNDRTVFRLKDIAMLTGESNFQSLNKKLNYHVGNGKLLNPRKGIYAKPGYLVEEMACSIYAPAYISLEYVLQRSGILFQYDSQITLVSYLSRNIEIGNQTIQFRRIKESISLNIEGIVSNNNVYIASPERAFLDLLYLETSLYFDNLNPLDEELVKKLLPIYQSKALEKRVNKILRLNGY